MLAEKTPRARGRARVRADRAASAVQSFMYLPPKHPALACWDLERFPWQDKDEWHAPAGNTLPPVSNTGGKFYQTYGERIEVLAMGQGKSKIIVHPLPEGKKPKAAIIDTLTFTVKEEALQHLGVSDDDVMVFLSSLIGPKLRLRPDLNQEGGWKNFYQVHYRLIYDNGDDGRNLGFVAIGGNNDTICIHITGEGCHAIPEAGYRWLTEWLPTVGGRITNVHLAHDDFAGQHSVELAATWYLEGKFIAGGRKPSASQAGNWLEPDGTGRTLYIGKRENGKMLRVYEKGKQLGEMSSPWVRWEGELRSTRRVIPFDVLVRPGMYLAGMYPCLGWIAETQERVRVIQKTASISYAKLQDSARIAYGRFIYAMQHIGHSAEDIVNQLIRTDKLPKRLILPLLPSYTNEVLAHG